MEDTSQRDSVEALTVGDSPTISRLVEDRRRQSQDSINLCTVLSAIRSGRRRKYEIITI